VAYLNLEHSGVSEFSVFANQQPVTLDLTRDSAHVTDQQPVTLGLTRDSAHVTDQQPVTRDGTRDLANITDQQPVTFDLTCVCSACSVPRSLKLSNVEPS